MLQKLKSWMLPIAMTVGILFYKVLGEWVYLSPYLIFAMLLITYSKLSLRTLRPTRLHAELLVVQFALGAICYFALRCFNIGVAEGVFIAILAPTASAAAVVTGMLGGDIAALATYCLISNLTVAALLPFVFTVMGTGSHISFVESILHMCSQMGGVLFLPLLITFILRRIAPTIHHEIAKRQQLSFYIWTVALAIASGKTTSFIMQSDAEQLLPIILLSLLSLVVCISQFTIGRKLGRRRGDAISGGQALGQKNTILAIWLAQTYLSPIACIAPASYVLWQNIINSWQLWRKTRNELRSAAK